MRRTQQERSVVVARRLGDLVLDGVIVVVFDERHGGIIVIGRVVVAVGGAHAGFFGSVSGGVVVIVVGRQDRLMAFLVDLRSPDLFFLVLVGLGLLVLDLIFGLFVVGGIAGTNATAAHLQRLFGVEVGGALGAGGRG